MIILLIFRIPLKLMKNISNETFPLSFSFNDPVFDFLNLMIVYTSIF
jgi:hypothetical protein